MAPAGTLRAKAEGPLAALTPRTAGFALIAAGLLWQPALAYEKLAGPNQPAHTWQYFADNTGFVVATLLLVVGLIGLDRARIAGDGRAMRWAMHGLVVAWSIILAGEFIGLVFGLRDIPSGIVGGLLTYPTTLVAGVGAVKARRLTGWRRWALLFQGIFQFVVVFLPIPLLKLDGPSWAAEAAWQLIWALVGVAALTAHVSRSRDVSSPGRSDIQPALEGED